MKPSLLVEFENKLELMYNWDSSGFLQNDLYILIISHFRLN